MQKRIDYWTFSNKGACPNESTASNEGRIRPVARMRHFGWIHKSNDEYQLLRDDLSNINETNKKISKFLSLKVDLVILRRILQINIFINFLLC